MPRLSRRGSAVVVLAAALASGCDASGAGAPEAEGPTGSAPASPAATAEPAPDPESAPPPEGTALAGLGTLEVKGRAPMTGYEREQFGQAWADVDRNGCDTRNDVLRRDLVATVLDPRTDGCVVLSGDSTSDPYTGKGIHFQRGTSMIDIDHVVALADAWQKGAATWDVRKRIAFGNDPLNLLAVDAASNRQKGAGDAATWLPGNRGYRCRYVARQVAVKTKYRLWVTAAERTAIAGVLAGCPQEPVPVGDAPDLAPEGLGVVPAESRPAEPGIETETETKPGTDPAGASDPRFDFCYRAKAAGFGPYVRGVDEEYDWYKDADGDGKVCE